MNVNSTNRVIIESISQWIAHVVVDLGCTVIALLLLIRVLQLFGMRSSRDRFLRTPTHNVSPTRPKRNAHPVSSLAVPSKPAKNRVAKDHTLAAANQPKRPAAPPTGETRATQTVYDAFDDPKCVGMTHDLRGFSYSKLMHLSINDLRRLCELRHIPVQTAVRHLYVHHLMDWKQQNLASASTSRRASLLDAQQHSDPIAQPSRSTTRSKDAELQDTDEEPVFEMDELFFDDLSLDEKSPRPPIKVRSKLIT